MKAITNNPFSEYLQNIENNYNLISTIIKFPVFQKHVNAIVLWKLFLIEYQFLNNKGFRVDDNSRKFVFTIIYYFLRGDNFNFSPSIYKTNNCIPSLDKGLLIVGSFGVGKTTILKTIVSIIEKLSLNFNMYPVRMHNTVTIVEEFENSLSNFKNDTIDRYSKGFRIFDDVKNEREASNFGKVDLFKEILYKRCETKNFRTIILCNYDSNFPNDMNAAIESFARYGDRNYDRLFEAFNFVEFKGSSNRIDLLS
jgi:DNA replication protein DnaC